jgi:cytochrome P450
MTLTAARGVRRASSLKEFRSDPIDFLQRLTASSESAVQFRIGPHRLTLLKDADLIEEILVKKQAFFRKGPGLLRLRPVVGDGLLTIDNSQHMDARRLLQSAFSVPKVAEYAQSVPKIIDKLTDRWRAGQTIELQSEMSRLTLAVIAATAFNSSNYPDHKAVGSAITSSLHSLFGPLSRCPHEAVDARDPGQILTAVLRSVEDGHTPSPNGDDLLSLLSSEKFDDQERRDHAITILLGGHESAAISLTWSFYALSLNPGVRQKLEHEIDNTEPSNVDIREMPYARQVIAESLRMYPTAWMFTREAIDDVMIGTDSYPAGSLFVVAPIVTHRDPRYWENPMEFRPERWDTAPFTMSAIPRFSYFPFGGGARRCIGEQFALMELPLILAGIGRHWRLDRPSGATAPVFDPVVTLRPAGGLPMVLSPR